MNIWILKIIGNKGHSQEYLLSGFTIEETETASGFRVLVMVLEVLWFVKASTGHDRPKNLSLLWRKLRPEEAAPFGEDYCPEAE